MGHWMPGTVSGGGGGGGDVTNITYSGASAWGSVAGDGTIEGSLNVASCTKTGTATCFMES